AAARLGWIVMSSYNTLSDGPPEPNVAAVNAMLASAAGWSIDTSRLYLAGFSGTARAALAFAVALRGHVAGVIAAGGAVGFELGACAARGGADPRCCARARRPLGGGPASGRCDRAGLRPLAGGRRRGGAGRRAARQPGGVAVRGRGAPPRGARSGTGPRPPEDFLLGASAARFARARGARGEARDRGAAAHRRAGRQRRSGERAAPARAHLGEPGVLRAARVSGGGLARS